MRMLKGLVICRTEEAYLYVIRYVIVALLDLSLGMNHGRGLLTHDRMGKLKVLSSLDQFRHLLASLSPAWTSSLTPIFIPSVSKAVTFASSGVRKCGT